MSQFHIAGRNKDANELTGVSFFYARQQKASVSPSRVLNWMFHIMGPSKDANEPMGVSYFYERQMAASSAATSSQARPVKEEEALLAA